MGHGSELPLSAGGRCSLATYGDSWGKWPIAQIKINRLTSGQSCVFCQEPGRQSAGSVSCFTSHQGQAPVLSSVLALSPHNTRLSSEHTQTKHQPSDLFTKQIPTRSGIPLLLLMKYCRLVLSVESRSPLWPQRGKNWTNGPACQHQRHLLSSKHLARPS